MVTNDELDARRELAREGDLRALLDRLRERARPILERMPSVPRVKAMLSREGGICPTCGHQLGFDPWEPERHTCPACGTVATGERHDAHWARHQHLWLAERAAHLALVGTLADDEACLERARALLAPYYDLYPTLPNRDNVLGPSHLFFSTYLESMWVLSYLTAAFVLRERGRLSEAEIDGVNQIADEAAYLIGEFNEGLSNRQTWNAAALTAIAAWFADEELAATAVQSPTGLLGHLTDGFGADGLWYEGENYHLFAIRGLMLGLRWARTMGLDLLANPELAAHFADALMAPSVSALPDLTFPARKDARYGVSLAHPAYLECWEAGYGRLGDAVPGLEAWLHALYRAPARPAATYDAYLHDAGLARRDRVTRVDLSAWMLLEMAPSLPPDSLPWEPASRLLASQQLAILRRADRYLSLECGSSSAGHGHPDLMHLTLHAAGVHWLADPGAGSYVNRDLFWYRSALAHNAPILSSDGGDRSIVGAAFDEKGEWGWAQAVTEPVRRSVVMGPDFIVDLVEVTAADGPVELPWHLRGELTVESPGGWTPDAIASEFMTDPERFTPAAEGPIRIRADAGEGRLGLILAGGVLLRARAPGLPGETGDRPMLLVRAPAEGARLVAVLDLAGTVTDIAVHADHVAVASGTAVARVSIGQGTATVEAGGTRTGLSGFLPWREPPRGTIYAAIYERREPVEGRALRLDEVPALDGSLEGFDLSAPIELADELHYLRSEEPYDSPEELSAEVHVNWDEGGLYLAALVRKPEVVVRPPDAPSLGLDNEPEDIHSDGLQVYFGKPGMPLSGFLIRPSPDGGIWARPIPGSPDQPGAAGGRLGDHRPRLRAHRPAAVPRPGRSRQPGPRVRCSRERDAAGPGPAGRSAGLERRRRMGLSPGRSSVELGGGEAGAGLMRVAGETSTGSKRPAALFGAGAGAPDLRMTRSEGAWVWDERERRYLDLVMALGAVTLGYGHPHVTRSATAAVARGVVGSLPPVEEEQLASLLAEMVPGVEQVRFLKTGAEAVAAAVRIARAATGRERVIGCGYHGWLDLASTDRGVPGATRKLYRAIPFNDPGAARDAIEEWTDELAVVVVEPVVDGPPSAEWLELLRHETRRVGAVLVFDEIKTGFRVALGGATERWGVRPDLVVLGKALANGFPLAAVGGPAGLMAQAERTWISSTLATESVALAAASAALAVARVERVPEHLARMGGLLYQGFQAIADKHARLVAGVAGIPEMCYLRFRDEATGARVARDAARDGLLFKRSAYNFVSLAHGEAEVRQALDVLDGALGRC